MGVRVSDVKSFRGRSWRLRGHLSLITKQFSFVISMSKFQLTRSPTNFN